MPTDNRILQLEQQITELRSELARLRNESGKSTTSTALESPELKSLIDFLEDSILVIDTDGVIVDVNPQAAALFGVPEKSLLERSIADFLPDYWQNQLQPQFVNAGGETVTQVVDFSHSDGSSRHLECRSRLSFLPERHLVYLRDTTQQIQVDHAAFMNAMSFKTLAENIPDNITRVDRDLNYIYVNPTFAKFLSQKPEDIIGNPSSDYFSTPEGRDQWIAARKSVIESGQPTSLEFSVGEDEHDVKTFHALLVPEFDENGEVESILSVSREITEYKIIQERLKENVAFAQRITEISPYLIFIYDEANGEVLFTNPVARDYLRNAKGNDSDGEQQMLPSVFHPEDFAALKRVLQEDLLDEGKQVTDLRCRIRCGVDDWRVVRVWLTVFHQLSEQTGLQILGIAQDITEQEQSEQQAFQLAVEQERVNILTNFIHAVSHEFRTPLASIGMSSYLLNRVVAEEHSKYLERIQNASDQISRLVEGMLQLTELDAVRELETNPEAIREIISMVIEANEEAASEKQLTIELEIADDLPLLPLDSSHMFTTLSHLVENAIRYTEEQGHIKVIAQQTDNVVQVKVQDDGVGIPKKMQKRVFERFYRLDNARSIRGLGLGLPIAQRIVELHGGTIELESEVEMGSTFTINLPFSPVQGVIEMSSVNTNGGKA